MQMASARLNEFWIPVSTSFWQWLDLVGLHSVARKLYSFVSFFDEQNSALFLFLLNAVVYSCFPWSGFNCFGEVPLFTTLRLRDCCHSMALLNFDLWTKYSWTKCNILLRFLWYASDWQLVTPATSLTRSISDMSVITKPLEHWEEIAPERILLEPRRVLMCNDRAENKLHVLG